MNSSEVVNMLRIKSKSKMLRLMICFCIFMITACQGEQYTVQFFTYPSSIPAHETGWTYRGSVKLTTLASGSIYKKSNKKVDINIVDENHNILFSDSYEFQSVANIKTKFNWIESGILRIDLLESGSEQVDDEYSNLLAQDGDRILKKLVYKVDIQENTFTLQGN